MLLFNNYNYS